MQEFALAAPIYRNGLAAPGFHIGTGDIIDVFTGKQSVGDWASKAAKDVGGTAKNVGKVFGGLPMLAVALGSGARVDKALVDTFKKQVGAIKDFAPYVATVVSFVPGIGSGVSSAIGAGLALAEGKTITEAVATGIKSALPGGPVAAAAFDTAMKVAKGENVGKAALEAARGALPGGEAAKKAFDTGVAVVTAMQAQTAKAAPKESSASNAYAILTDEFAKARPQLEAAFAEVDRVYSDLSKQIDENERIRQQKLAEVAAEKAAANKAAADKAAADLIALSKLTPKELQGVKDMQALAKLTPDQQKQLVAYATAAKAAADAKAKAAASAADAAKATAAAKAAAAAPSKTATVVKPSTPATTAPAAPVAAVARGEYGPYPASTGAVHGLGFSWGADTKWRWFVVQANGKTIAQRGPLWLSDAEAIREEMAFRESMLGRGYIGTVTRWDWSGANWQRAGTNTLRAA